MIEECSFGEVFSIFIVGASSPCTADILKADVTASLNQINQPNVPVEIVLCLNYVYPYFHNQLLSKTYQRGFCEVVLGRTQQTENMNLSTVLSEYAPTPAGSSRQFKPLWMSMNYCFSLYECKSTVHLCQTVTL